MASNAIQIMNRIPCGRNRKGSHECVKEICSTFRVYHSILGLLACHIVADVFGAGNKLAR
jgi:hypothetical protein